MSQSFGFGVVSPNEFVSTYWDRRPLFAEGVVHHPLLRLRADRIYKAYVEQALENDEFTSFHTANISRQQGRDAVLALWDCGRAPAIKDVVDFNQRCALIIRGGQKCFPELASFLVNWRQNFQCRLNANVYLTRRGSSVFSTHYDQHHVFAVQLDGEKEWHLWPPTIDAPHGRYQFRDVEPKGDPLVWLTRPGDLVYIPLGWVHRAKTVKELSIHVTVGVNPPRWLDLIEQAVDQAAGEFSILRHGLPFRFTTENGMVFFADPDRHLAPIISLLTKDLAERMQTILRESRELHDEVQSS